MVALQKNNTLNDKLEYVAFTLIFILFGLAVVAASLDLLVLRFVTMNTEDERRDEAEALQVKRTNEKLKETVRGGLLIGVIIPPGVIITDGRRDVGALR